MRGISAKVRVARLADRQAGLVGTVQLVALGVDPRETARWVRQGYLLPRHPRVYAVAHRAPSVEADLTAAVLYAGPGAMLSHATALWWLGLIETRPRTIDVSTPRRCRSLPNIRVHGRRSCQRGWHKRVPTTTMEQALLDYAAVAPLERVRHALGVRTT
jgi:predicted transcriptional regulator of viral defense system